MGQTKLLFITDQELHAHSGVSGSVAILGDCEPLQRHSNRKGRSSTVGLQSSTT